MAKSSAFTHPDSVVAGRFHRNLTSRRSLTLDLPEFLLYALEARVLEATDGEAGDDQSTLNDYIETELANLITLRDVAELDLAAPGFAEAVQSWLNHMR